MKALLIDAYDSFVFIIEQYLRALDLQTVVMRCDDSRIAYEVDTHAPDFIVLGPGPGRPEEAGYPELIERCGGRIPLLGVCLGHQAIGLAFGAQVVRAKNCMHGKTSSILNDGCGVFAHTGGKPIMATRYHSLVVEPSSLSKELFVTARSCDDGYVMGLRHKSLPIEGVQFHPESVSTEGGLQVFRSFISTHVERPRTTGPFPPVSRLRAAA
jgi:anthranilate synthase component II